MRTPGKAARQQAIQNILSEKLSDGGACHERWEDNQIAVAQLRAADAARDFDVAHRAVRRATSRAVQLNSTLEFG